MRKNTRRKVSCEAIPLGKSKNFLNQLSFARPNSSISSQVSAAQIVAHTAITRISTNWWSFVRSRRGSGTSPKLSNNESVTESLIRHSPFLPVETVRRMPQLAYLRNLRCVRPSYFIKPIVVHHKFRYSTGQPDGG